MKKLIVLSLVALTMLGCQLTPQTDKPTKPEKTYTGWDEGLSKVICYTNGVTLKYDNILDKLKIGIQDDITGLTDYNDSSSAKLINVNQEKMGDITVYNLVYAINNNLFKYQMSYGLWKNNKADHRIHNSPGMKELGYKPIKGMLIKNGKASKKISFCWGINNKDRQSQTLKQSKKH